MVRRPPRPRSAHTTGTPGLRVAVVGPGAGGDRDTPDHREDAEALAAALERAGHRVLRRRTATRPTAPPAAAVDLVVLLAPFGETDEALRRVSHLRAADTVVVVLSTQAPVRARPVPLDAVVLPATLHRSPGHLQISAPPTRASAVLHRLLRDTDVDLVVDHRLRAAG